MSELCVVNGFKVTSLFLANRRQELGHQQFQLQKHRFLATGVASMLYIDGNLLAPKHIGIESSFNSITFKRYVFLLHVFRFRKARKPSSLLSAIRSNGLRSFRSETKDVLYWHLMVCDEPHAMEWCGYHIHDHGLSGSDDDSPTILKGTFTFPGSVNSPSVSENIMLILSLQCFGFSIRKTSWELIVL